MRLQPRNKFAGRGREMCEMLRRPTGRIHFLHPTGNIDWV